MFRCLDKKFVADVVGDGTGDVQGPFELAKSQFFYKGVLPFCVGAFAKINEDFDKTIRYVARFAASEEVNPEISLLSSSVRRSGSFPIMLQQFRRAIAKTIDRRNAKLKYTRMHYIRRT